MPPGPFRGAFLLAPPGTSPPILPFRFDAFVRAILSLRLSVGHSLPARPTRRLAFLSLPETELSLSREPLGARLASSQISRSLQSQEKAKSPSHAVRTRPIDKERDQAPLVGKFGESKCSLPLFK